MATLTISQITDILRSEIAKLKSQGQAAGFKVRISSTEEQRKIDVPESRKTTYEYLINKVPGFLRFKAVDVFVGGMADGAANQQIGMLAGQTKVKEINGLDEVVFYPETIQSGLYISKDHSQKEMVRSTVRHEFRHAEQFIALRKVGISVKTFFNREMKKSYRDRLIEKDAYAEEYSAKYRPISHFMDEVYKEYRFMIY